MNKPQVTRRQMLALAGASSAAMALSAHSVATAAPAETTDAQADHRREPSLDTRLTREYGVRFPFVGAGMGFVSMPALAAAVSNAGGIGVLGNGIEPPPGTQSLIQQVKALTPNLFGIDFLFDDSPMGPLVIDAHIDVCIAEKIQLVVFHSNVPPTSWIQRLQASGARVWMQAASVEQAIDAAAAGVDVIIAQGSQAGGHNKSTTRTLPLVRKIIEAVGSKMVLASGGIADGRSVAEALGHGAAGVWVGTRLVMSTEAYAHPEYQRRILAASDNATVTTTMFGPEFPDKRYRVLRNRVVNEFAGREAQIPNPPPPPAVIGTTVLFPFTLKQPYSMPKFSAIVPTPDTKGDFEEMGLPAGADSVRVIKRILPAARIVAEMMAEAEHILREESGC